MIRRPSIMAIMLGAAIYAWAIVMLGVAGVARHLAHDSAADMLDAVAAAAFIVGTLIMLVSSAARSVKKPDQASG